MIGDLFVQPKDMKSIDCSGQFHKLKLELRCTFKCDPIHNNDYHEFGHHVVLYKSDLDVQQTKASLVNKSSSSGTV